MLVRLDVYRNFATRAGNDDAFAHLTHRGYLVKGLSARQRVQCALTHYRFEELTFNESYRREVYLEGGMSLWQHESSRARFAIKLAMAPRFIGEGELMLSLLADGKRLHCMAFNWIEGSMVGLPCAVIPLVVRNQGRTNGLEGVFAAFEAEFPHSSPSFFCFAALQGLAQALGMTTVVGVKSTFHIHSDRCDSKHLSNAYDGFWKKLGGTELPGSVWRIELPFYQAPLQHIVSRHRKRAKQRRTFWEDINASARDIVQGTLARANAAEEFLGLVSDTGSFARSRG